MSGREIYSLTETLTKNFEVNSTNMMESYEQMNIRMDKWKGKSYIPLSINAGGIMGRKYSSLSLS